jgi:hypothetical protein
VTDALEVFVVELFEIEQRQVRASIERISSSSLT